MTTDRSKAGDARDLDRPKGRPLTSTGKEAGAAGSAPQKAGQRGPQQPGREPGGADRAPGAGATSDQLRDDIDTGRTGDKVAAPDPAAAPLGSDAEAGGHAPTTEEVQQARREERRVAAAETGWSRGPRTVRSLAPRGTGTSRWIAALIVLLVALAAVAALAFYL